MIRDKSSWVWFVAGVLAGSLIAVAISSVFQTTPKIPPFPSVVLPRFSPSPSKKTEVYTPQVPDLTMIFNRQHDWIATLSAEHLRTLVATGDVSLARQVNIQILQKNNPLWPLEKTAEYLRQADVVFINLESPLVVHCPLSTSGFTFCGNADNVKGLVFAGVDVANIANNHAGNYGREGVQETVTILEGNGIEVAGAHGPVYKTIRGVLMAFLGYNEVNSQPGIALASAEKQMKEEIQEAQKNADIVVVQFHWGVEYTHQPTQNQKRLAHFALDSGADLIIGNHPHWYQAVEFYKNKFIMYSHGNFIFDQMWSQKTREGVIGKYTFYDDTLVDVEFTPIIIEDYGQPNFMTDQNRKDAIVASLEKESLLLAH